MHNFRHLLFKSLCTATPLVFLITYAITAENCFMLSCTGNNDVAIVWGIATVIIYITLLNTLKNWFLQRKNGFTSGFWNLSGTKTGFFYLLIVLIVLFVYFLGKANGSL